MDDLLQGRAKTSQVRENLSQLQIWLEQQNLITPEMLTAIGQCKAYLDNTLAYYRKRLEQGKTPDDAWVEAELNRSDAQASLQELALALDIEQEIEMLAAEYAERNSQTKTTKYLLRIRDEFERIRAAVTQQFQQAAEQLEDCHQVQA